MFSGLPKAIRSFRRRYPRVELRLRELVTSAQIAALLDGTIDLGFLRDGDPTPGIETITLLKERYIAVLPQSHPLARKRSLRVNDLADQPFLLFARQMGPLAFDRAIDCCQRAGFRPNIVQEAPQWSTLVRLVAAGLGVSLAPACLTNLPIQEAVYRDLRTASRTTIDAATRLGSPSRLATNFLTIARHHLSS